MGELIVKGAKSVRVFHRSGQPLLAHSPAPDVAILSCLPRIAPVSALGAVADPMA